MNDLRIPKIALLIALSLCLLCGACDQKTLQKQGLSSARLLPKPCWFEIGSDWPLTHCYMMEVPENYTKPEGRKIRFPVVRFIPTERNPEKHPLLHLGAGGPGASLGLEPENANEWLWINYAAMSVDDGRELIVIDPRGTGMAQPRLTCEEFIEDADIAFQRNLSPDEEMRVFTFSMERCYSRLSKTADLAHYNSVTIAKDIEELRKQLGVEKFNLYGVSYASRYALTLARDYPDSVRVLVLNSAVFPEIKYVQQLAKDTLKAFERGLEYCTGDKSCNSRYPNLKQRLESLVQTLDENPLTVHVQHRFANGEYPFVLTGQRLLRVLFQALYDENFYSELPKLIESLENGDVEPAKASVAAFMEIVMDPYFGDAAGISHFCYEEAPFVNFEGALASAANSGILAGTVHTDLELMQIQCRIWAIPPASPLESRPIKTSLPVLVMHGALDPVLSVDVTDQARRKLPNHQWLLFPHLAHDVISASNCAEQAAALFLNDPSSVQVETVRACRQEELGSL